MTGPFPVPFAVDEQGRQCVWPIGRGHLLACGTTGSGKSSIPRAVVCHVALSTLVQPVGIDLEAVELSQYEPRLSALAVERDEAVEVLGGSWRLCGTVKPLPAGTGGQPGQRPRGTRFLPWSSTSWPSSLPDGLPKVMQRVAETSAGHLDRIGRMGRALGVGLLACTQRAEAGVIGGALRSLFAYRFSLASLDVSSYKMALGLSEGVDLAHLSAGLSIDRPGQGLWLDPSHPTVRVARVAWWDDAMVEHAISRGARFMVEPGQLIEWAAQDATALAGAA